MKKIVSICLIILFTSCMTGCGSGTDDLIWSNGESVRVHIYIEYKDEILEDVDKYFEDYDYKRLYISEIRGQYVGLNIGLELLFVLNEGQDPLEFKTQIGKDEKVAGCYIIKEDM